MVRSAPQTESLAELPLPLFAPATAALPPGRLPSYIRDHRKRLRARFLDGGAAAVPDYELLELVLFGAIPRADVKPLARALIDRFGGLASAVTAPPAQLMQVEGVGETVVVALKLAEAVATRLTRARVMNRPVISSWAALLDYCHTTMAHRSVEHVRVLYLDRKNCLIADEETGQGTVDHVPLYPREILRRGLELQASALILVHNHPSGDPTPSQQDIALTERIRQGAEALSLVLHDHLVIGKEREFSFRAEGLL
ncbi:MAG: DNA repair protein RadC [Rhodobacteraceae bacterium]|nr:DNA repair protein RadC [Paracoccaceae bacterium]